MVHDSIDNGCRHHIVLEYLAPILKVIITHLQQLRAFFSVCFLKNAMISMAGSGKSKNCGDNKI
jgi:hypothetical protein